VEASDSGVGSHRRRLDVIMSIDAGEFKLRKIALAVYLPTFLFAAGESAVIPVIPMIAKNIGADLATAGFVAAMLTVGIVIGDIPSGSFVARVGERVAMLWSSAVALLGIALAIFAVHPLMLGAGMFLLGLATAAFALARHAFLTTYIPFSYRARSLSLLGGMFRGGGVAGPLLAAGVIALLGDARAAFLLTAAFTLATFFVLLFLQDPESAFGKGKRVTEPDGRVLTVGEDELEQETHGLFKTIWSYRYVLVRLGTAAGITSSLRSARTVLFPLWALSIGLGDSDTALIMGIATGVDFALFFTSGQVMDKYGRIAAVLPSVLIMSLGILAVSFTHNLQNNVTLFILCVMVFSLGNGLGSGIILTIASDLAPKKAPAPFLGAWRFSADVGAGLAPVGVAAITAASSLSIAAGAMGILGLFGVFLFTRYIPRLIPHAGSRTKTRSS
jgi:MFS family permease